MKNFIRKLTPKFLLEWYRLRKKKMTRSALEAQAKENKGWTKSQLINQLEEIGIQSGDTVLVHSALSKMGFVKGGPDTVVNAILEVVGTEGNVLMPNSPNASLQLDYIHNLEVFDVKNDKSKLGVISEKFRIHPEAKRSWHPTEPVSCIGPDADYFVGEHFGEITPYNKKSPFYKVSEKKGKILMIGVTLDNAGTNLHTLEDAVDHFKFPVYYPTGFEVNIKIPNGEIKSVKTKVHNPVWSKKRKCDKLIPLFEKERVLRHVQLGNAPTLLLDAERMLKVMIKQYDQNGVTMYTPFGS
ncbi:MAG: AAC(3) family N-acetyltransferase [Brumimicrobium sp.]